MQSSLIKLAEKPIQRHYSAPSHSVIEHIKKAHAICPVLEKDNIIACNSYHRDGLRGTHEVMLTRAAVWERLQAVAKKLLPDYGLMIFDTYRSVETQAHLFEMTSEEVHREHPDWDNLAVDKEVRKFVVHPTDRSHFSVPPHNSGGAVDLAIYKVSTGKMCDFGTKFDAVTPLSNINYFEQDFNLALGFSEEKWQEIRANRRRLFHLMMDAGFTNYQEEWWHYDLGDCLWAREFDMEMIFLSMEQ